MFRQQFGVHFLNGGLATSADRLEEHHHDPHSFRVSHAVSSECYFILLLFDLILLRYHPVRCLSAYSTERQECPCTCWLVGLCACLHGKVEVWFSFFHQEKKSFKKNRFLPLMTRLQSVPNNIIGAFQSATTRCLLTANYLFIRGTLIDTGTAHTAGLLFVTVARIFLLRNSKW